MAILSGSRNNKREVFCAGMILSEILLAGAVISLALGSAVIVVGGIQSMLIGTQNGFVAQLRAREEISLAHLTAFDDLAPLEKTDGFFTTNFSVAYRNAFSANVSADVSWYDGLFQKHQIITDQIVDWENSAGAADCDWLDSVEEGDLLMINFGTLNIDDGNIVTDVDALGDFVYISADSATSSLSDLYVVDVHDIQNPNIVGSLNTGPGIASIAAAGHYVFVANAGSYQMQIVDVSDPVSPALVAQAKLPGAIVSGSAGFGKSVHFFDNKMYIGLVKNAGTEFHIVDVSDPQSPIALGSYEIDATVNGIDVQSGRAIVVAPGQTSVFLLDTSNPSAISEIAHVTFSGWQTQGAKSVEMLGPAVWVGRTLGGFFSPYPELMVLDRDFLSATSTATSTGLKIGASVEDIFGFNNYLYLTTSDADKAFQILRNGTANDVVDDTSSMPTEPPTVVETFAFSSRGVALSCNSEAMYVVTQNDQDFFHIFSLP